MDITDDFELVKKLVAEKTASMGYAAKKLNSIFDRLIKEYAPDAEIERSRVVIANWHNELQKIHQSTISKMDQVIRDVDQLLEDVKKDVRRIEKGLKPIHASDEEWKPTVDLEETKDFSNLEKLVDQLDIIMRLQLFAKYANRHTIWVKTKFKLFSFALQLSKALLTCLGILISYFVGLLCESQLQVNALLVTFIGSILCLYTSDRWLGNLKDKLFWFYAHKVVRHTELTFQRFSGQKLAFKEFSEKYLGDGG